MAIVEVAISIPLHRTFDYLCDQEIETGVRVKVPFGAKKVIGIVLSNKDKSEFKKLKSVEEVLDESPILIFYSGLLNITTTQLVRFY